MSNKTSPMLYNVSEWMVHKFQFLKQLREAEKLDKMTNLCDEISTLSINPGTHLEPQVKKFQDGLFSLNKVFESFSNLLSHSKSAVREQMLAFMNELFEYVQPSLDIQGFEKLFENLLIVASDESDLVIKETNEELRLF